MADQAEDAPVDVATIQSQIRERAHHLREQIEYLGHAAISAVLLEIVLLAAKLPDAPAHVGRVTITTNGISDTKPAVVLPESDPKAGEPAGADEHSEWWNFLG